MKILSIDPGNIQSAYCIIDSETFEIGERGIVPNQQMLSIVGACGCQRITDPTVLVVEMIQSFGMAVGKEVFETVFWIGRYCQAWPTATWHRVYRGEVKLHLCGSARAKDSNIRQALLDRLGPQGVKKAPGPTYGISKDVWSAVAVGLTWIDQNKAKEAS